MASSFLEILQNNKTLSKVVVMVVLSLVLVSSLILGYGHLKNLSSQLDKSLQTSQAQDSKNKKLSSILDKTAKELDELKSIDQVKRNDELEARIQNIEKTYKQAVKVYDELVSFKETAKDTDALDKLFAQSLTQLSDHNYSSAESTLTTLSKNIASEKAKLASTFTIPDNVPAQTAPPGSGYRRQRVDTSVGNYLVDIISADLNSTRVIVDTASDGTCADNCPVASLATYVSRSGAFAGINGPYFCPASYAGCAGKTNSFDTLLMNKNKVYFNSDNNVYSTVPAVIFSGGSARYVTQSLEWGRDTSPNSVIASQPLLMLNGTRVFGGDTEPKRAGKGSRSFIGSTGSTVYIGVVHNASVAEVAFVLEAMGIQNALNLDSGGSTALWSGRYIVGPGRDTPFGILLVK